MFFGHSFAVLEIYFWEDSRKLSAWKKGYKNERRRCSREVKKKKKKKESTHRLDCKVKMALYGVMDETTGKRSMQEIVEEHMERYLGSSPIYIFHGEQSAEYKAFFYSHPMILSYMIIYNILSIQEEPVRASRKLRETAEKSFRLYRLLRGSKWKPNTLLKTMNFFYRLTITKKQKKQLLAELKAFAGKKPRANIYSSVNFVVHSIAMIQVTQKSFFYRTDKGRYAIGKYGSAANTDRTIATWANVGLSKATLNKVKHNEALKSADIAHERYYNMPSPKTEKWTDYLVQSVGEDLDVWLDLPETLAMQTDKSLKNCIIEVVKDSKENLANTKESAIILGQIPRSLRSPEIAMKIFMTGVSLWRMFLRKGPKKNENAIWFAVTVDVNKIMDVVNTIFKFYKRLQGRAQGSVIFEIFDMFIKELQQEKCSDRDHPVAVPKAELLQPINPSYGYMSKEEREKEFQDSMQCTSLAYVWRLISAFSLHHAINGKDLINMDKTLSKDEFVKNINDPLFINSLKVVWKADVSLEFLDNMLPKSMKTQLKRMTHGKATWFSYAMKLASILLKKVNLASLSLVLSKQAPYMGNMVNDWQNLRRESKIQEIAAHLTFGVAAFYSYTQIMEALTQSLGNHGKIAETAQEKCGFGAKNCLATSVSSITLVPNKRQVTPDVLSQQSVAATQLLIAAIFSILGSMFWQAIVINFTLDIIKSQIKIAERLSMGFSNLVKIGIRKLKKAKSVKKFFSLFKKTKQQNAIIEDKARAAAAEEHREHHIENKEKEYSGQMFEGDVRTDTKDIERMFGA